MTTRTLFLMPVVAALAACAINQKVTPVERFDGKQVCIIENPAVVQAGLMDPILIAANVGLKALAKARR